MQKKDHNGSENLIAKKRFNFTETYIMTKLNCKYGTPRSAIVLHFSVETNAQCEVEKECFKKVNESNEIQYIQCL